MDALSHLIRSPPCTRIVHEHVNKHFIEQRHSFQTPLKSKGHMKKIKKIKNKQKEQNRIPAPKSCFTAKSQHNATLLSCMLTRICCHRNCTSTFCTKQALMNHSRVSYPCNRLSKPTDSVPRIQCFVPFHMQGQEPHHPAAHKAG